MRINGEPDESDRFDLPPMPSDIDDFGELLDVARSRVDAQRTGDINKRLGAWEPLYTREGTWEDPELVYLVLELARLIVGAVAALFILLRFWITGGILFAVEGLVFFAHWWWKKKRMEPMWEFRRSIRVRAVGVGLASSDLWKGPLEDPEQDMQMSHHGLIVWTDDPVRERDPAWLHELAHFVAGLPERSEEETPEHWRPVRRFVAVQFFGAESRPDERFAGPVQLPSEALGNEQSYAWITSMGFTEMPNGYLDRTVLLALQAPGVESGTCILDRYYWWNDRADVLTRSDSYFEDETDAADETDETDGERADAEAAAGDSDGAPDASDR